MSTLSCNSAQASFSAYLDGALDGHAMRSVASHIEACNRCQVDFTQLLDLQRSLASLGSARAPRDLGMKLRVAISHEAAQRRSRLLDTLSLHWQNALRPLLVQVSAGFAGTIVLVGGILMLLGMVATPEPVMANDEPLGAITPPHFLYTATGSTAIATPYDSTIVVEALINAQGRVYDFHIVSGPTDLAVQTQLVNQLLLTVFQPAQVFGSAIRGRAILTFSGISVRA